jgi:hypothetical protein
MQNLPGERSGIQIIGRSVLQEQYIHLGGLLALQNGEGRSPDNSPTPQKPYRQQLTIIHLHPENNSPTPREVSHD